MSDTTRNFPHSGRIDQAWIEQAADEDPWLCISDDINNPNYRDALIANGLIGLRVPPEGEGQTYRADQAMMSPDGCLMHGLWTDDKLMAMPVGIGLQYHDGSAAFTRDAGEHRHYQQTLDMRTATLTTTCEWHNGERVTTLQTRMWLSLADENCLVIETEFTPQFSGEVSFIDSIIGLDLGWNMGGLVAPRYRFAQLDQAIEMQARMGEKFRRIAVRAEVQSDHALRQTVEHTTDHTQGDRHITRRSYLQVQAGTTYRVRKVAALVSDADASDPAAHAAQVIARYSADPQAARAAHEAAWGATLGASHKRWQCPCTTSY